MPEPIQSAPAPQLTTKTKTRTKAVVATLVVLVGIAALAYAGVVLRKSNKRKSDLQLAGAISVTNANFSCVLNNTCRIGDIYGSIQIVNMGGAGTINPFTVKFVMQKADGTPVPINVWSASYEGVLDFNAAIRTSGFTQSEVMVPVETIIVAVPRLTGNSAQGPGTFVEIPAIISKSYYGLGAAKLVVTVDAGNTNAESNEGNNIKIYDLPLLPDLVADVFIAERVEPGIYVIGEIKNTGSATMNFPGSTATNQVFTANIEFLDATGNVIGSGGSTRGIEVPLTLAPGEREILRWDAAFPVGTVSARITADPNNVISEANESNNSASGDLGLR